MNANGTHGSTVLENFPGTTAPDHRLDSLLGSIPASKMGYRWNRWAAALSFVALVGAGLGLWRFMAAAKPAQYATAQVAKQTITRTISATGTLQAVTTVQVGTETSGTVSQLYADFNSQVKKDQVIARLDDSQFLAQLQQANATYLSSQAAVQAAQNNVTSADAAVQSAQANVDRMHAALVDAQTSYERTRQLVEAKVEAVMTLQTADSTKAQAAAAEQQAIAQLNQAKAQAQGSRSQVAQAQAQAAQAKAAVNLAQVNVDHTIIKAPIDGVVVARNVDVGQTVAASLQAPTIFLIANDLTQMQVLANIDEADVGQLRQGSTVNFTVDAYPKDVFHGIVSQIRLSPQTVQNVVTYTAVIDVRNSDLKLMPGMTANVTVTVGQRENVTAIPNQALRFHPDQTPAPASQKRNATVVWKVVNGQLQSVPVRLGMSDGIYSEVVSGDLTAGDKIALPTATAAQSGQAAVKSPFAPAGRGGR